MLKLSSNEKGMIFGPNDKRIIAPMEHTPMVYILNEKCMVYERFFFEVVMVIVKDERKYNKKMQCQ